MAKSLSDSCIDDFSYLYLMNKNDHGESQRAQCR